MVEKKDSVFYLDSDKLWEIPYGVENYITIKKFRLHDKYYCTFNGRFVYENFEGKIEEINTWIEDNVRYVSIYDVKYEVYTVLLHVKVGIFNLPVACKDKMNPTMKNVYYRLYSKDIIRKEGIEDSIFIRKIEFKQISEFPEYYISDQGMIYSNYRKNFLRYGLNLKGQHRTIELHDDKSGKRLRTIVGRLVWETWKGIIPSDKRVRYKYSYSINSLDNLELANPSDIIKISMKENRYPNPNTRKWSEYAEDACKMLSQKVPYKTIIKDLMGIDKGDPEYVSAYSFLSKLRQGRIYKEFSNKYRFKKYKNGRPTKVPTELGHKICHLMANRYDMSMEEIANECNIDIGYLRSIRYGRTLKEIAKNYDLKWRKF